MADKSKHCEHVITHIHFKCHGCSGLLLDGVTRGKCPDSCSIRNPVRKSGTENHADRTKVCMKCQLNAIAEPQDRKREETRGNREVPRGNREEPRGNREEIRGTNTARIRAEEAERVAKQGQESDSSDQAAKEVSDKKKGKKAQQGQGTGGAAEAAGEEVGGTDKVKKRVQPFAQAEPPYDSSASSRK